MGTVGLACWLGGIIFINRKKTDDAISVMAEAAHTMLSQDIRVWVFPEGTRNHSGSMLPFKRGAFHLAVQAQVWGWGVWGARRGAQRWGARRGARAGPRSPPPTRLPPPARSPSCPSSSRPTTTSTASGSGGSRPVRARGGRVGG
uniref:1-acylglycerol-3-phosphate O-acyltransferase n=1 Tax=Apteryx owenii TaxID=8824 RepID=A0A8B9Q5S3_APTOW